MMKLNNSSSRILSNEIIGVMSLCAPVPVGPLVSVLSLVSVYRLLTLVIYNVMRITTTIPGGAKTNRVKYVSK